MLSLSHLIDEETNYLECLKVSSRVRRYLAGCFKNGMFDAQLTSEQWDDREYMLLCHWPIMNDRRCASEEVVILMDEALDE